MVDNWPTDRSLRNAGFGRDMIPVTPSDTADLPFRPMGLYIEGGGAIAFVGSGGVTRTVNVDNFAILPVSARRILAAGTTATGIHGIV